MAKNQRRELPPGARWRGKSIQVQVYRGYDAANDRRLYASGTAKSVTEAWRLWANLTEQVENQEYIPPNRQTVGEWLDEWLDDVVKPNRKRRTYIRYEGDVRLHIKPKIENIHLRRLTPEHIEKMLGGLAGKLSDTSRLHVYRVLNRALNVAVRWKRIKSNPCYFVDAPTPNEPFMYIMSGREVNRLLNATEKNRMHALYVMAVHTGMRRGELFGLHWTDVDLHEQSVWVRQSLTGSGTNPIFETPKNNRSRYVPLADEVIEALKAHKVQQELERVHYGEDYRDDHDLVFRQASGGPTDESSFQLWNWHPMRKAAGLPEAVRFHDLRHTFVSRALAAGANLRAISEMVGHHDPGFTARRYAHALQEDHVEAVRRLGEYLDRTASEDEAEA